MNDLIPSTSTISKRYIETRTEEFIAFDGSNAQITKRIFHREDGPAITWTNGIEEWYLEDVQYISPKEMPLNLFFAYCKWEMMK